jgi:ActR/RegA family two-component response regulator
MTSGAVDEAGLEADVLLVDDDVSFLRMAQESLCHLGFRVHTVATAMDAIRAVSERVFDIVVTDLVLDPSGTVESSVDLIEQLKRHSPSIPIIVLSGFASSFKNQLADLRVPVLEKGANTTEELHYLIRRMIRQRPRQVEPETMALRLEDVRRVLAEELPRLVSLEQRTIIIPSEGRVELPKPLQGFKVEIQHQLNRFRYEQNVFLMMKFRPHNRDLALFIGEILKSRELRGVRADDEGWNITRNVYNPVAVLHCCKYGIALFDELEEHQAYSANVAYELGMMHQQQKHCLILRHTSLPPVPFDLLKELYVPYERELQVKGIIERWVNDVVARDN